MTDELHSVEWTHPVIGRVSEVACLKHEQELLGAFNTLGIGCGGEMAPLDAAVCDRCAYKGIPPRQWLRAMAADR